MPGFIPPSPVPPDLPTREIGDSRIFRVYFSRLVDQHIKTVILIDKFKSPEDMIDMNSTATAILADEDLSTAIGAEPVRDAEDDTYSCQLKCHDANSETYYVTFSRDKVRI